MPAGQIDDDAVQRIDRRFEEVHDQLFGRGSGDRTGGIDFTAFQVRATAKTGRAELMSDERREPARHSRAVYWSELRDYLETPVYDEVPAESIEGPALIELPDTVIVVRPGQQGAPDAAGNYVIELRGPATMNSRFEGKVALVTGGGSGIGEAIARRLAADERQRRRHGRAGRVGGARGERDPLGEHVRRRCHGPGSVRASRGPRRRDVRRPAHRGQHRRHRRAR